MKKKSSAKRRNRHSYLRVGTLVEIEFLDHAQGTNRQEGDAPVLCRAVGWVYKDEPGFILLSAWISGSLEDSQSDHITLVKHPEMKIRRLKGGSKISK